MSPGFLVWSRGMAELHSTREERWFVVGLQTSVSFALVRLFLQGMKMEISTGKGSPGLELWRGGSHRWRFGCLQVVPEALRMI